MAEAALVRLLALALPEAQEDAAPDRFNFSVGGKGFAWTYLERVAPKAPRRPRPDVLAVRCLLERKELLIEAAPQTYFDDDQYRGYPAVLVHLATIEEEELASILESAWRLQAPQAPAQGEPG